MLFFLLVATALAATTPAAPSTAKTIPTATPTIPQPTKAPLTDEKQAANIELPEQENGSVESIEIDYYGHPGVVARQGISEPGKPIMEWIGGDHLINLPSHLPVQINLSIPSSLNLKVTERQTKAIVDEVFKKYGLNPDRYTDSSTPPLPFFNVLISIYQVPKGYVYVLQARLFESVELDRVAFDEGVALQAITWEMSSINGVPEDKLIPELSQSLAGMATTFAQRYNYFKKIQEER